MGEFVNRHFVSIKINGKKGDGPELKKSLKVPGYPTVLFINADGEELYRAVGFGSTEDYLLALDYFTSGVWKGNSTGGANLLDPGAEPKTMRQSLTDQLAQLEENSDDIDLNFMVAMKYNAAYKNAEAQGYFQKVLALDPDDTKGFREEARFRTAIHQTRADKNIEPLHLFLQNTENVRYLETGYPRLLHYYGKTEAHDLDQHLALFEEAMERLPESADVLSDFAWFINDHKIEKEYGRGIELAKKSLLIDAWDPYTYNVLAWLYFKTGENDKAMEAMNRSIKVSPDNKYLENDLKKLKDSIK